ncbi:hypothetical protein [Loigolactobacillus binensis]|uniref:Uncharacterized protein n=1 Tax=Loigolactobacillus binensis TaxID=2559922 RepID=A0ABW3EBJ7_9LACO|nr:hypothetical protein [Loigolactobacillus binensis]
MAWQYYLLMVGFLLAVGFELWFSAHISPWWLLALVPTLAILLIKSRRHK